MADYYKSAIAKMMENISDEDLAFFYALMAKMVQG